MVKGSLRKTPFPVPFSQRRGRSLRVRADRGEKMAGATSASYPPPLPFYKLYKEYANNPKSGLAPPPPIQGTYYSLYDATYTTDDVLPSLEDQGVRQLYPKGPNVGAFFLTLPFIPFRSPFHL
ncbi:hypothetical protein ACLOJK_022215 [Asimina triloba]